MQKIVPNLWFDTEAEEAAEFYCSIFKDSEITGMTHYPESAPGPTGSVMTVDFRLFGQDFTAINGGPDFKFTEAVSFLVGCDTQEEVDELWEKLLEGGGQEVQCGWLKDRYGLSWQIVPKGMDEMFAKGDPARANNAMKAMLQMKKLDLAELQKAYDAPVD